MEVADWLRNLGLERYAEEFRRNDIDAATLAELTESDLKAIGVQSVGHRRKLATAISELRRGRSAKRAGDVFESGPRTDAAPSQAEHRQLSVLYCDLVGSTALSQALDGEDYRDLIRKFHDACLQQVAKFDGWVANFIGDCILAYFGWPRAHEDDAERAVRAGLSMMQAVGALQGPGDEPLQVRTGVATGAVVVGDLIDTGPAQEQSAVGVPPNLAARLQALAEPGQMVVDDLTRRLLGLGFAIQSLGRHPLKGFAEPVDVHSVLGERQSASRFDARRGHDVAPMVGRDHELAMLLERWTRACGGEGQAVLLLGEAGIGKSRIVRGLLDACTTVPHNLVRWQCSPYHTASALWPVIQRLSWAAGLQSGEPTDEALDKIEVFASQDERLAAVYATLLGLNGAQRYGPVEMAPQMLREHTLELLTEQLLDRADQHPLLFVVEDTHWIDPTTFELIERCLGKIEHARMLVLMTCRTDSPPSRTSDHLVTRLSLNRLSRASVEEIATRLGGQALSQATLATIVAQTDGVPLFVEELTKAVLETGGAAIPASLHGSLLARLDRIPDVKEVAQVAACIGRDFDQRLLQEVTLVSPQDVADALGRLASAELVFRRGPRGNPRFTFKHALVQEAARDSLLRGTRQAIHARILQALQRRGDVPSEVLAHHAQSAGQVGTAISHWTRAGIIATGKSAYAEAAETFTKAIDLVPLCEEHDRTVQGLELQLRLGLANMALLGFPAQATKTALSRANELVRVDQSNPHYYAIKVALWGVLASRAELDDARRLADETLATALARGDEPVLFLGHRLVASSHMLLGDFATARLHFDRALTFSSPTRRRTDAALQFSADPEAAVFGWYGLGLTILGDIERSRAVLDHAREVALGLDQAHARAFTFYHLAIAAALRRDAAFAMENAEITATLAATHRLPQYRGSATVVLGWVALESGRPVDEALGLFERGLAELTALGRKLYLPIFLAWQARACAAAGRHADARRAIEQAIAEQEERPQGWLAAEVLRLEGATLLQDPGQDLGRAIRCFERALALARAQGARLWELRAAVSLADAWKRQGRPDEVAQLLAPICEAFADGVDAIDVAEARQLLAGTAIVPPG